jgi:uncharacterized protein (TIGR01777 family)
MGTVLSSYGGIISKMKKSFNLGLGGIFGNGKQYISWVSLKEVCNIIDFLITADNLTGAVNVVSPSPITNREFTHYLGSLFHRPTVFKLPKFILNLFLGEMAKELLLSSTRAEPKKLHQAGYKFVDKYIENVFQ